MHGPLGFVPLTKTNANELYQTFYLHPGKLLLNNFYIRLDENAEYQYECRVFTRVIEEQRRKREEKVQKIMEEM